MSIWHRDASRQASINGILQCVLESLEPELQPKPDNYFYKRHADHAGFRAPPELQAVLDSQKRAQNAANAANANSHVEVTPPEGDGSASASAAKDAEDGKEAEAAAPAN